MAGRELEAFNRKILASAPSATYLIARGDAVLERFHGGFSLLRPFKVPAAEGTIYDLASLTKPLVTALLALKAFSLGLFDIERPVGDCRPPFTPLDLMRHEAGFPAWYPLYKFSSKEEVKDFLLRKIPRKDAGREAVYSCPAYVLLGFLLEEELKGRLDELFVKLIREPLGIGEDEALFNPPLRWRKRIAGEELDGSFEKNMALNEGVFPPPVPLGGLWGVVHDGNARFLGGVAGNAGLFATLDGVRKILGAFSGGSLFLEGEVLKLAYRKGGAGSGESRSAGFKLPGSPGWTVGEALEKGWIAHEGFTGTFIATRENGDMMILLTNRIHPAHPRRSFSEERAAFAAAARGMLND